MKPVMIRAFGRTGTTLMMQILNTSDQIFVPNGYPFESRFLSYFTRMAQVPLSNPDTYPENYKWNDEAVNQGVPSLLGCFPYPVTDYVDERRLTGRFLIALWNQFGHEVKMKTGVDYLYYAEKVSLGAAPYISSVLEGSKSIYIVRDPRGELASIMSFNKKRGFNGFGWTEKDTIDSYAKRMISSRKAFYNSVFRFWKSNDENNYVVRYEDLVGDPKFYAAEISKFLGVDLSYLEVKNNEGKFSHHMTNNKPVDSIDSWRSSIPSHISEMFINEMYAELNNFSYVS